jgi:hypothetical protein
MKDVWYQAGVRAVPHVLIERANNLLLVRQGGAREIEERVVHGGRDFADV